jgi:hypothetical protein
MMGLILPSLRLFPIVVFAALLLRQQLVPICTYRPFS